MKRKVLAVVITLLLIFISVSCKSVKTVAVGKYYLNGNKNCEYIEIVSENVMKFVNFDIDYLASYIIDEGTGFTGQEAVDFMERQNLPNVFSEEIEYEVNEASNTIYLKALTTNDIDSFVANYSMAYENNTITFLENEYVRVE